MCIRDRLSIFTPFGVIDFNFITVQESFFTSNSSNTDCYDRILQYCVERDKKCREILQYLTIDGRHSAMSNLEIIYQDATTQHPFTYADNFDDLITNIIYPIYSKRFSERIKLITKDQDACDCSKYGQNCLVALTLLESTLKTFYRTYHVLNKEFDDSISTPPFNWENYYGTLVANINFQFDNTYEEMWHLMKTSNLKYFPLESQVGVSSTQLHKDLVKLLESMIPSHNISLLDFLGLAGYNDEFRLEHSHDEHDSDLEKDCSAFNETFRSTCKHFNILKSLHPLLSMDPIYMEKPPCDLGVYLDKWTKYLDNLKQFSDMDSKNHDSGKEFIILIMRKMLKLLNEIFDNHMYYVNFLAKYNSIV